MKREMMTRVTREERGSRRRRRKKKEAGHQNRTRVTASNKDERKGDEEGIAIRQDKAVYPVEKGASLTIIIRVI